MRTGNLNERAYFEKKLVVRDPDFGTETVTWVAHATAWANISESHATELVAGSERTVTRVVKVRTRWVPGVTSDMRIRQDTTGRLFQITSIAELRKRLGLDLIVEEYSA